MSSRAKAAALEAARRRRMRKRLGAAIGAGVLVLAVVGGAVLATGGKDSKVASSANSNAALLSSTTTTQAALPSAAGKPCVAVTDPLPTGAPDVPVQVGPPPTALVTQDLKQGDGAVVTAANTLSVNYIGVACSTGKIFDSSFSRGQPASFPLAQVIQGWQQGLAGMKVGGERLLGIPAAMAYGSNPPPGIAPDEALWFVVDVLSAS